MIQQTQIVMTVKMNRTKRMERKSIPPVPIPLSSLSGSSGEGSGPGVGLGSGLILLPVTPSSENTLGAILIDFSSILKDIANYSRKGRPKMMVLLLSVLESLDSDRP